MLLTPLAGLMEADLLSLTLTPRKTPLSYISKTRKISSRRKHPFTSLRPKAIYSAAAECIAAAARQLDLELGSFFFSRNRWEGGELSAKRHPTRATPRRTIIFPSVLKID